MEEREWHRVLCCHVLPACTCAHACASYLEVRVVHDERGLPEHRHLMGMCMYVCMYVCEQLVSAPHKGTKGKKDR